MEIIRQWVTALVHERTFDALCPHHGQPREYFSFGLLRAVCYSCDGRPAGTDYAAPVVSCFCLPPGERRLLSVRELQHNFLNCEGVLTIPAPTAEYPAVYVSRDPELGPVSDGDACVTCKRRMPIGPSMGVQFCSFGCKYLTDSLPPTVTGRRPGGRPQPAARAGPAAGLSALPQEQVASSSPAPSDGQVGQGAAPHHVSGIAPVPPFIGAEATLGPGGASGIAPTNVTPAGVLADGVHANSHPAGAKEAALAERGRQRLLVGGRAGAGEAGEAGDGAVGACGAAPGAPVWAEARQVEAPNFHRPVAQCTLQVSFTSPRASVCSTEPNGAGRAAGVAAAPAAGAAPDVASVLPNGSANDSDLRIGGTAYHLPGGGEGAHGGVYALGNGRIDFSSPEVQYQNAHHVQASVPASVGDTGAIHAGGGAYAVANDSSSARGGRGRGRGQGRGRARTSRGRGSRGGFRRGRGGNSKGAEQRKGQAENKMQTALWMQPGSEELGVDTKRLFVSYPGDGFQFGEGQFEGGVAESGGQSGGSALAPDSSLAGLDGSGSQEAPRGAAMLGIGSHGVDSNSLLASADFFKGVDVGPGATNDGQAREENCQNTQRTNFILANALSALPINGEHSPGSRRMMGLQDGRVFGPEIDIPIIDMTRGPGPQESKPRRAVGSSRAKAFSSCEVCGSDLSKGIYKKGRFCSRECRYGRGMKSRPKQLPRRDVDAGSPVVAKHQGKPNGAMGASGPENSDGSLLVNGKAPRNCSVAPRADTGAGRQVISVSKDLPPKQHVESGPSCRIRCSLCRSLTALRNALCHPLLGLQSLRLCRKCGACVFKRLVVLAGVNNLGSEICAAVKFAAVDDAGFGDEDDDEGGEGVVSVVVRDADGHALEGCGKAAQKGPAAQKPALRRSALHALRLIAAVEELVFMSSPQDLESGGIGSMLVDSDEPSIQQVVPLKELGMPLGMLAVVRVIFVRIGVSFQNGKLSWPLEAVTLPSATEVMWAVETALPRSASDREMARTAGMRVWNETFPANSWTRANVEPRAVFGLVLGLFGIALAPPRRSSGRRSEGVIELDPLSVSTVMHDAFDRCTHQRLKSIFDSPQLVFPRALTKARQFESESKVLQDSTAGEIYCSCCGSLPDASAFPFRFISCSSCSKQVCSLCMLHVFGVQRFVCSSRIDSFECQSCRTSKKLLTVMDACASGLPVRRRPASSAATKKGITGTRAPLIPPLVVSPAVYAACVGLKDDDATVEYRKLALFCEKVNDAYLSGRNRNSIDRLPMTICLVCKEVISAASASSDGTTADCEGGSEGGLVCSAEHCDTAVHCSCVRAADDMGIERQWQCGYHTCSVCAEAGDNAEGVDGSQVPLVRCRLCPKAFCEKHLPPLKDSYVYSGNLIVCPTCVPLVDPPKLTPCQLAALENSEGVEKGQPIVPAMKSFLLQEKRRRHVRVKRLRNDLRDFMEGADVGLIQVAKRVRACKWKK